MIETHQIGRVVHEANRALQVEMNDPTIPISPSWDILDHETRTSTVQGVVNIMSGQVTTPEQSHASWCEFKTEHGWTYGPVKDETARTHPLLVDYADLPAEHQIKDAMFFAIVKALNPHLAIA